MTTNPSIFFTLDGEEWEIPGDTYDSRTVKYVVFPGKRVREITEWLESYPPQPIFSEPITLGKRLARLQEAEITKQLGGILPTRAPRQKADHKPPSERRVKPMTKKEVHESSAELKGFEQWFDFRGAKLAMGGVTIENDTLRIFLGAARIEVKKANSGDYMFSWTIRHTRARGRVGSGNVLMTQQELEIMIAIHDWPTVVPISLIRLGVPLFYKDGRRVNIPSKFGTPDGSPVISILLNDAVTTAFSQFLRQT